MTSGLSYPVYKGVMRKGYKVPTPIQRKVSQCRFRSLWSNVRINRKVFYAGFFSSPLQTIPVILDGKDIVAMARTGSGKTAAFLVPMFEKLKAPQAQTGARALILTPTRELALQTMKFTKEVRLTSVCCCLFSSWLILYVMSFMFFSSLCIIVGKIHWSQDCLDPWWRQVRDFTMLFSTVQWDPFIPECKCFFFSSMDDQFAALHENPDMWVLFCRAVLSECFSS